MFFATALLAPLHRSTRTQRRRRLGCRRRRWRRRLTDANSRICRCCSLDHRTPTAASAIASALITGHDGTAPALRTPAKPANIGQLVDQWPTPANVAAVLTLAAPPHTSAHLTFYIYRRFLPLLAAVRLVAAESHASSASTFCPPMRLHRSSFHSLAATAARAATNIVNRTADVTSIYNCWLWRACLTLALSQVRAICNLACT